jgi:hypothetical protein
MNKKAQLDYPIIGLFIFMVALLIFAPIMLKIFRSVQEPISANLGNLSDQGGGQAQANFNGVMNTAVNFWDKVIVFAFFIAVVLMFISAIFIDTNPFFVVLYIFISMILVIFAPDIIGALDPIYNSSGFIVEVGLLPFTNFLRVHYAEVLIGLIVITGIIIYGKTALFASQGGSRR